MQSNAPGDKQQGGQKPSLSWSQPAGAQKPAEPKAPTQPNLAMKSLAPAAEPKGAAAAATKSNTGLYSSIFIGGLIVGVLLGWGVTGMRGGEEAAQGNLSGTASSTTTTKTSSTSAAGTGAENATLAGTAALSIPSPQAAGLTVSITHADVSAPTWVVIYEDHNGVAGNALGAGLFYPTSQGGTTSGTIELLRGTLPGETYLAGESLDDGDHKFSLTLDKPVRDAQGNPLWVEFKTQ